MRRALMVAALVVWCGSLRADPPEEFRALDALLGEESPGAEALYVHSGLALATTWCAVDCDCRFVRELRLGLVRAVAALGGQPRVVWCHKAEGVAFEVRRLDRRERAVLVGSPGVAEVRVQGEGFVLSGPMARELDEDDFSDYSFLMIFRGPLAAPADVDLAPVLLSHLRPASAAGCGFRPYPAASFSGSDALWAWSGDVEFLVPGRLPSGEGPHAFYARRLLAGRRAALAVLTAEEHAPLRAVLERQVGELEALLTTAEAVAGRLQIERERERLAAAIAVLADSELALRDALAARLLPTVARDSSLQDALALDGLGDLSASQERGLIRLLESDAALTRCWAAAALRRSTTASQRDALLEALADPSDAVVECALSSLSGNGHFLKSRPMRALQRACAVLTAPGFVSPQRGVRQTLAASGQSDAVDFVIDGLLAALPGDPAPWEARRQWLQAVRASAEMADPETAAYLLEKIATKAYSEGPESMRAAALFALDLDPGAMAPLVSSGPALVRMAALQRVGPRNLDNPRLVEDALAAACAHLDRPDPELRFVTMAAIAGLGRRAKAAVKGAMQAREPRTRAAACSLLGTIGSGPDRRHLEDAREDPDVWVRRAAARALLGLPEVR